MFVQNLSRSVFADYDGRDPGDPLVVTQYLKLLNEELSRYRAVMKGIRRGSLWMVS